MIGADVKGFNLPCEDQPITSRLAMICGTSTCHMAVSKTICESLLAINKKKEIALDRAKQQHPLLVNMGIVISEKERKATQQQS